MELELTQKTVDRFYKKVLEVVFWLSAGNTCDLEKAIIDIEEAIFFVIEHQSVAIQRVVPFILYAEFKYQAYQLLSSIDTETDVDSQDVADNLLKAIGFTLNATDLPKMHSNNFRPSFIPYVVFN